MTDIEEYEAPTACASCGAELWPDVDRAYVFAPDACLCFECAERRGGSYDAEHDRWSTPPDVSDLLDERRPHP